MPTANPAVVDRVEEARFRIIVRPEAPPLSFHNVAARSNGCSVAAAVGAVAMESPYGSSGGVSCRGTSSGGTSSGVGSVVGGTGVLFSIALRLRPLGLLRATFFRAAVLRPAVMRVAVLRAAVFLRVADLRRVVLRAAAVLRGRPGLRLLGMNSSFCFSRREHDAYCTSCTTNIDHG